MKRRLYFLIPDAEHARAVVNDLESFGINIKAMHVLAKPDVDVGGLPAATGRQRIDAGTRLETILWDGNLTVYLIALLALIILLFMRVDWTWLLLPAAFMVVTFTMGIIFTSREPHVHLDELNDAMQHGEILLMVDVPLRRVKNVKMLVHDDHPEATVGGVGWHIDALNF